MESLLLPCDLTSIVPVQDYKATVIQEADEQEVPPSYSQRTTVPEVENAVRQEMYCHAFGNTPGLVDTHFGSDAKINKVVERVYKRLVSNGIYDPEDLSTGSGHWKDLPTQTDSETVLYTPLTAILNAITEACRDLCRGKDEPEFDLVWRDEHNNRPESLFMADMKPDIVATFRSRRVWWRSIQTLIEVKKVVNPLPAAVQLLRYVRQALREQPDRRFIYGMVFSLVNLTVWHVDRTGALASEMINIHKDPMTFIKVIVGFSLMSPARLGWDPTMQMYVEDKAKGYRGGRPSYKIDEDASTAKEDAYARMWIVDMPKPDSPGVTERFVLYYALSLARSEVIRGRATRVWKAWKLDDMDVPSEMRAVYIFKDCWRDEARGTEGELYKKAAGCAGVAVLYSYGEVYIPIGNKLERDSTLALIRRDVEASGKPLKLDTDQRTKIHSDGTEKDSRLLPSYNSLSPLARDQFAHEVDEEYPHVPRNRIHSRLVMSSFGFPLTKFIDLPEFLGGFYDAINGHRNLFLEGILHRDISTWNIILTGLKAPNRSLVIDLDNSIEWKTHNKMLTDDRSGTPAYMSYEILKHKPYFPRSLDDDLSDDDELTLKNTTQSESEDLEIRHGIVHDLESFFWVLCWICMTREGPGTARDLSRKGKDKKEDDKARQISDNIVETFEGSVALLAERKVNLMRSDETFQDIITSSFSPYFVPLIRLVRHLRRVLVQAYKHRQFDDLHEKFLNIFKAAQKMEQFQTRHDGKENEIYKRMAHAVSTQRSLETIVWDTPPAEKIRLDPTPVSKDPANKRKRSRHQSGMSPISEEEEGELPVIAPPLPSPPAKRIKTTHEPAASSQPNETKAGNAPTRGTNAQQAGSSQQAGGSRQPARGRNARDQSREISPSARAQGRAKRGRKSNAGGSRGSLQGPGEGSQVIDGPAAGAEGQSGVASSSTRPQAKAKRGRNSHAGGSRSSLPGGSSQVIDVPAGVGGQSGEASSSSARPQNTGNPPPRRSARIKGHGQ